METYARAAGGGGGLGKEAVYHGRSNPLSVQAIDSMSSSLGMKILICDLDSASKPEFVSAVQGRGLIVALGFSDDNVFEGWLKSGLAYNDIHVSLVKLSVYVDAKKLADAKYVYQTVTVMGCPHARLQDVSRWIEPFGATLAAHCKEHKITSGTVVSGLLGGW